VVTIGPDTDLARLRAELVEVGSSLLVESLARGLAGLPTPHPQEGEPTIAAKLTPEDLRLHWEEGAVQLHRVVRLDRVDHIRGGRRLGILKAVPSDRAWPEDPGPPGTLAGTSVLTGAGTLELQQVQPESRAPMPAEDWARRCATFAR